MHVKPCHKEAVQRSEDHACENGGGDGKNDRDLRQVGIKPVCIIRSLHHGRRYHGCKADHTAGRQVGARNQQGKADAKRNDDARGRLRENILHNADLHERMLLNADDDDQHCQRQQDRVIQQELLGVLSADRNGQAGRAPALERFGKAAAQQRHADNADKPRQVIQGFAEAGRGFKGIQPNAKRQQHRANDGHGAVICGIRHLLSAVHKS